MIKMISICMLMGLLTGCMAHKLTSSSMSEHPDVAKLQKLRDLSVSVIRPEDPLKKYEFREFIDNLRSANIFKRVEYKDEVKEQADLELTFIDKQVSPDFYHTCSLGFEGEMLTVVTFGLVPQICTTQKKMRLTLASRLNKANNFDISYEEKSVFGWLGLINNISPEWTWRHPEIQQQQLIQSIMEQNSTTILSLME